MPEYEKVEISLRKAKSWLNSLEDADLHRFITPLRDATAYAIEQSHNLSLPSDNRTMYANEARGLVAIVANFEMAQGHIDEARAEFIARFGDTPDADWWIFRDDFLG